MQARRHRYMVLPRSKHAPQGKLIDGRGEIGLHAANDDAKQNLLHEEAYASGRFHPLCADLHAVSLGALGVWKGFLECAAGAPASRLRWIEVAYYLGLPLPAATQGQRPRAALFRNR